jgi:hypothetical protein
MFRIFLFLSLILFAYALVLPVYADKPDLIGIMALLGGWMVALNDIPTAVSWLANVTFFFAIVMILKRKKPRPFAALVFSILSIVLACAILGAGKIVTGATTSQTVGKLAIGTAFYAWVGSFVLMAVAAWLKMKSLKPTPAAAPVQESAADTTLKS